MVILHRVTRTTRSIDAEAAPDVLHVGMGSPRQEQCGCGGCAHGTLCSVAVGGTFDVLSGAYIGRLTAFSGADWSGHGVPFGSQDGGFHASLFTPFSLPCGS